MRFSSDVAVLSAYWAECERRVYPLAASNPDGYMQSLQLVRAVADALSEVMDLDDLARLWNDRDAVASTAIAVVSGGAVPGVGAGASSGGAVADDMVSGVGVVSGGGVPGVGAGLSPSLGPGTLVEAATGAGFSLRANEIRAEQAAAEQRERISSARAQGLEWVVLHERGRINSGLIDPYLCVELHLASGLTVTTAAEADASTLTVVYVVSVAPLASGEGPTVNIDAADAANAADFKDRETSNPDEVDHHRSQMRQWVTDYACALGLRE